MSAKPSPSLSDEVSAMVAVPCASSTETAVLAARSTGLVYSSVVTTEHTREYYCTKIADRVFELARVAQQCVIRAADERLGHGRVP